MAVIKQGFSGHTRKSAHKKQTKIGSEPQKMKWQGLKT